MTFSIFVAARAADDGAAAGAWKAAAPTDRAPSVAIVPSVRARVMAANSSRRERQAPLDAARQTKSAKKYATTESATVATANGTG